MTAKKVEFKVGDIVCSGGNTYRILSITREPTAKIQDLGITADILTVRFSELATYAHFSPVTRIGRPPKTRKAESAKPPEQASEHNQKGESQVQVLVGQPSPLT